MITVQYSGWACGYVVCIICPPPTECSNESYSDISKHYQMFGSYGILWFIIYHDNCSIIWMGLWLCGVHNLPPPPECSNESYSDISNHYQMLIWHFMVYFELN